MPVVLVADDHAGVRQLVIHLLSPAYEMLEAENGAEALVILRERAVDVVVIDLDMPILSGHRVCEEMRADARLCGIPIVLLTGSQLEASATTHGVQVVLSKPSGMRRVRAVVDLLLSRSPADPDAPVGR